MEVLRDSGFGVLGFNQWSSCRPWTDLRAASAKFEYQCLIVPLKGRSAIPGRLPDFCEYRQIKRNPPPVVCTAGYDTPHLCEQNPATRLCHISKKLKLESALWPNPPESLKESLQRTSHHESRRLVPSRTLARRGGSGGLSK